MRVTHRLPSLFLTLLVAAPAAADYTNYEASHVNPIDLTPDETRLLAVNTPDALLEVFSVLPGGDLMHERSIPVGLEPVTVVARSNTQAWVVNQLSDSVSVVDLTTGLTERTLHVGDEPSDVAFANGRAFVTVAGTDTVEVFDLLNLDAGSTPVPIFGRKPRAVAASSDGQKLYVVPLLSGNQTTVVNANIVWPPHTANLDAVRLVALGLNTIECDATPPSYPDLPTGITRDASLPDPPMGQQPENGLIVRWNETNAAWEDEDGGSWNDCLPYRLPDHDLFVIDSTPPHNVTEVDHLGTSLFEVSVHPSGKIYVPNTDARNFVRFEHPLGVQGHMVDNRLSIVDPNDSNATTLVDLNTHVVRTSDPPTNLAERQASISQPGMMVWNDAGTAGYLTAIGSRKLFRVDGACAAGACIFGPSRAAPNAVDVGEGPTGVALLEVVDAPDRLYVLNRIDHTIALIQDDAGVMTKLGQVAWHDPSPQAVVQGRRFLYDAIDGSGHGDAACSSCHISGDRDDLAWDLGNPEGEFVSYEKEMDNVRFVVPVGGTPTECDAALCASHDGVDPEKGLMTTQTLRGMLEPLHWRGDRATMNDFNMAFVGLMGTADIGPINDKPAGLSAMDMEKFRQFALGIRFGPNPNREVDDTIASGSVTPPGQSFAGNPAVGETLFNDPSSEFDGGQPCTACHTSPFGAGGGKLDGVTPLEPTSSDAAALFNGDADQSRHNDLKIPHLRNMYEKIGPVFGDHVSPPPLVRSGFGFSHDGGVPDLGTFLSIGVFTMNAQEAADVATFLRYFPTGTKPAVGQNLTLAPSGPAPPAEGVTPDEQLLTELVALCDASDGGRHCELVAATAMDGRLRHFR
ncbi:MAG: YncE family protein, partial [Planctomycetota bacterium]